MEKIALYNIGQAKKKIYFKSSEIADRTTELFSCSYLQCSLNQKDNTAILRDSCGRLEKKKRKKKVVVAVQCYGNLEEKQHKKPF